MNLQEHSLVLARCVSVCACEIVKRNKQIKFVIDEIHERSHSAWCRVYGYANWRAWRLADLNGVILRTHSTNTKQWGRVSIAKKIGTTTSERTTVSATEHKRGRGGGGGEEKETVDVGTNREFA